MKTKNKYLLNTFPRLAMLVCIFGMSSVFSAPITIVSSTDNPEGSLHVLALEKFGELLEKYSNGELKSQIHYRGNADFPAERGEEVNMNMVMSNRKGTANVRLHATVLAAGNASSKVNILEFLMLPYIFQNVDAAKKLFRSDFMRKEINQKIAKSHNVRAVGWLIGGFRHLTNSVKPITKLADIKGLKIRTPKNRFMLHTYKSFGAKAKGYPWGQTFDALANGDFDGQENPYAVIVDSKFWNAKQKYVTNNGPFLWVGPILINNDFYNSLPLALRSVVDRAGTEAAEFEWDWVGKKNAEFKQTMLENGMQINELEDKPKWIGASKGLWDNYAKTAEKKSIIKNVLTITQK